MNKVTSWPKPPIPKDFEPPKVPEKFTIFGIKIEVKNKLPVIINNEIKTDVTMDNIKEFTIDSLNSSLEIFKKTIDGIIKNNDVTILVTQLRDLHLKINDTFNVLKIDEAVQELEMNKTKQSLAKLKIKEEVENVMRTQGFDFSLNNTTH
ncbi:hypothetical protein EDEG_00900 [Edhazardia aedis USNM 41457]|uniref:Mediator of RNA polymerase II transcription subunit 7 n=1 Tax=Edhazardia aedis (strain USNM 41457) TaxID=1003232 RepID=J8ZZ73_EDHAE|nr:hypothetical protein EDEG_00900 [Edhazardia aedis USNM 41457]|eukprot:EJW04983.1 hypothetical protein EDEG_00900 [Edhazardia aedis USNM 41457]